MPVLPLLTFFLFRVKVKGSTEFWQDGGHRQRERWHDQASSLQSHSPPGLHQTAGLLGRTASSFPYESDPVGRGGRDKGC